MITGLLISTTAFTSDPVITLSKTARSMIMRGGGCIFIVDQRQELILILLVIIQYTITEGLGVEEMGYYLVQEVVIRHMIMMFGVTSVEYASIMAHQIHM